MVVAARATGATTVVAATARPIRMTVVRRAWGGEVMGEFTRSNVGSRDTRARPLGGHRVNSPGRLGLGPIRPRLTDTGERGRQVPLPVLQRAGVHLDGPVRPRPGREPGPGQPDTRETT